MTDYFPATRSNGACADESRRPDAGNTKREMTDDNEEVQDREWLPAQRRRRLNRKTFTKRG
jgi:hypothetical protein